MQRSFKDGYGILVCIDAERRTKHTIARAIAHVSTDNRDEMANEKQVNVFAAFYPFAFTICMRISVSMCVCVCFVLCAPVFSFSHISFDFEANALANHVRLYKVIYHLLSLLQFLFSLFARLACYFVESFFCSCCCSLSKT